MKNERFVFLSFLSVHGKKSFTEEPFRWFCNSLLMKSERLLNYEGEKFAVFNTKKLFLIVNVSVIKFN